MGFDYNGGSYFWSSIRSLFDGETLTQVELYKGALNRIKDSLNALRDAVNTLRSDLGQQETVQPAVLYSTVKLGDLGYYNILDTPLGDLDGKTLILVSDIAGPVTVTFAQPGNPSAACAQINAQASALGIIAAPDDGIDPITGEFTSANVGRLRIKRYGSGTPSITVKSTGSANSTLGFSVVSDTTVTGTASTALDGASRVGLSALAGTGWTGGTLRAFLATAVVPGLNMLADKVDKAGDTMTGNLTMGGLTEIKLSDRSITRTCRTPWTFSYQLSPEWLALSWGSPAQQLAFAGTQTITRDIDAMSGDVITGVSVSLKFDGSHGSYPPAQFPRVRLVELDGNGSVTYLGSATDSPASQAVYESVHTIEITGLSVTVAKTKQYRIEIRGENEQAGLQIYDAAFTVTTKGLPPGG